MNYISKTSTSFGLAKLRAGVLWSMLMVWTSLIHAQIYSGPVPNTDIKVGRVMARSIVVDPDTNQPILVEFNDKGEEVGVISIGAQNANDLSVVPASEYVYYRAQLRDFRVIHRDDLAKGAELLSRNEYQSSEFLLADNLTTATKPPLDEQFFSVLVRGQSNRITDAPEQLVLLKFGLDLTQDVDFSPDDKSLVVNKDGQIVASSPHTIGYRTGFYGDPNDPQTSPTGRVGDDDRVFGPVKGVKVFVDEFAYTGGVGITDNEGKYSFQFGMPLCPIGGFTYTTEVWAELRYKNFLPTGAPSIPYYLRTPGYSYCYASLFAGGSTPPTFSNVQSNLYADVMFVTGTIVIKNFDETQVPIGITTFKTFLEEADTVTQNFYDFDGDGEKDLTIQGRIMSCLNSESGDEVEIFLGDDSGESEPLPGYACTELEPELIGVDGKGNLQGVFFDGEQNDLFDYPDLVRLIDKEFRNEPVGILKEISENDMRNTDLLFFRESTGQLILERRGLKQAEAAYRPAVEYDSEENKVAFRVMLRGRDDSRLNVGGGVNRNKGFEEWASEYQLTEPFLKRESDQPRPGEYIKIVAINRATGYTGTARVQLKGAGSNSTGSLDVQVPTIAMRPPNLRIWAKRNYDVEHGLTRGEDREYTIGAEGAALASDSKVTIFTEWLDENGKPLPEELGLDDGETYGLTGRFAKVVGSNSLDGAGIGSDLAEFPIGPGRKTQVLRVKGSLASAEHFYIHVIGKPKDQECVSFSSCPSFTSHNIQPNLKGRPALLTPFLVPLADEDKHWQEYNEYLRIKAELEELDEPEELIPNKPLPAYAWQYRPEYQFSQFDLAISELNRTSLDENGNERVVNILELENPTISSSDYVTALYSLISSEFETLKPIDGERDLILALGEQELRVAIGEDRTIRFDDVRGLENLDVEDFLTLRLYANNDAGNILWEYAFDAFVMYSTDDQEFSINAEKRYYVTADEPEVNLAAELLGYYKRAPENQTPQTVSWVFESGTGELTPESETLDDSALFNAKLTMPSVAGAKAVVKAVLETGSDVEARFDEVIVLPGEPAQISISPPSALYAQGANSVAVRVHVTDQFGNDVIDGTTVGYALEGDIIATDRHFATIDGIAEITLAGGYIPNNQNRLTVYAGEVSASTNLEVRAIDVAWSDALPEEAEVMTTTPLKAIVTSNGLPVKDAFFEAYTSRGALFTNQFKTDENGELLFSWHSGSSPGDAQFRLKIGGETSTVDTVAVIDSNIDSNIEFRNFYQGQENSSAMLVDGTQPEMSVNYLDIEEVNHELVYLTATEVMLEGQVTAPFQLSLRGLDHANREPLISILSRYGLQGREVHEMSTSGVSLIGDGPAPKTSSYKLLGSGGDSLPADAGLSFTNSSALRIPEFVINGSFKTLGVGDGEVINFNQGLIVERRGGQFIVKVQVAQALPEPPVEETFSVGIPDSQWFEFAVSVENNSLTVKINENEQEFALAGPLSYRGGGFHVLKSASNLLVSDIGLYDWSSPALTKFDNGSEVRQISLSGELTVNVMTSGELSDRNSQYVAQLKALDATLPIVLLHNEEYVQMAGVFVDAFGVEPSHSQVAALYEDQSLYGDPLLAASRLLAMVADDDVLYRESSAIITALALLRRIEGFEHLQSKIRVLQKFILENERPALSYAAVDNIAAPLHRALNGDTSMLDDLALPLTILAEILEYDPEIAQYMNDGIVSAQDMTAWFDHFTKPLDGWVGLTYRTPKIDATDCDAIEKPLFKDSPIPMSFDTCRQTGKNVADWVRALAFDGVNEYTPQEFVAFLKYMNEVMPYAETYYKKHAYKAIDPTQTASTFPLISNAHATGPSAVLRPLKWVLKYAGKRAKVAANFWLGNANHRISPLLMLYIMDYMQSRIDEEECASISGCKYISSPDVQRAIDQKINRVNASITVFGSLQGDKLAADKTLQCSRVSSTHGSMFELQLIMFYHLLHELDSSNYGPVVAVEESVNIRYGSNEAFRDGEDIRQLTRRVDIVVQKSGNTVTEDIDDKTWIEAKSLQVKQRLNRGGRPNGRGWANSRFRRWNTEGSGGTSYHRQYTLDNIAIYNRTGELNQHFAGDYKWWFQSWNNYQKPRTYKIKKAGKRETKEYWPGVPPDAKEIGERGDKDWNRAADRMAQVMKKVARSKHNSNALKDSIGFTNLVGSQLRKDFYKKKDLYGTEQNYFLNPGVTLGTDERYKRVAVFNLVNILAGDEQLRQQFGMPDELLAYYESVRIKGENVSQFIEDVTDGLEEYDIPIDIPVDEWVDNLAQKFANSNFSFFGDNCDF